MTITYIDTVTCDACTRTIGLDSGDGFVDMIDGAALTLTGWRLCPECADLCTLPMVYLSGTTSIRDL